MSGLQNALAGGNKKSFPKVPGTFGKLFKERRKNMDIHNLTEIIANQGFPIALSILLIFRIDRFMQEIVTAQKEGYQQILENTKEIHNTITSLSQQNREYYSLHFSEVQKELSGMRVELGKIE
jgi:hypothetical protein